MHTGLLKPQVFPVPYPSKEWLSLREKLQWFCSIAEMLRICTETKWVRKVEFRKTLGSLCTMDQLHCKKGVLVNVILPNVAVIACLSDNPGMLTCFEFLSAKCELKQEHILVGVWSMSKINEYGILYLSAFDTISW